MWTCPVCDCTNADNICHTCGFDHSTDIQQFLTLYNRIPPTTDVAILRNQYRARNMVRICECCGSIVTGDRCSYCGFASARGASQSQAAAVHADTMIAALTNFSIIAYRYAWEPMRSRLELQAEEIVSLGNARDFYRSITWADQEFGQLRNGTGTELQLDITYHFRGKKKVISCTIPTVKSDRFWRFGISIDASIHLRLYLGAGKKFIETAPIALDLT